MTTDLTARLDADAAHAQQIRAYWLPEDVPWLLARLGERDAALRAIDAVLDEVGVGTDRFTYVQEWWAVRDRLLAAVVSALSGGAE